MRTQTADEEISFQHSQCKKACQNRKLIIIILNNYEIVFEIEVKHGNFTKTIKQTIDEGYFNNHLTTS